MAYNIQLKANELLRLWFPYFPKYTPQKQPTRTTICTTTFLFQKFERLQNSEDRSHYIQPIQMISGIANSFASVTLLRILSRILQFFLRVYLIRSVLSPSILAEMVTLDLILTTSLHIAKNCFKPSYQQVSSTDQHSTILSSMNLMTLGVATTALSATALAAWQWGHRTLPYLNPAILVYAGCAVLDSLREKYSVQFTIKYQYRKLALIELCSYLPKTAAMFVCARSGLFEQYGILVFAVGQTIFSSVNLLSTFALTHYKTLTLHTLPREPTTYLDPKTKQILKEFSLISLLKLLLTQFEKIALVVNAEIQHASVYSLVSNLGSIAVRFLFAPLEEIAYNYYSRGTEQECKKTLIELMKVITVLSILSVAFGHRYAENVLFILYGQKWLNRDSILAFQCYTALLAALGINGTMQAFVMARADVATTVPKFKYFTLLSTSVFIASSLLLLHIGLGAAGLFLGNMIGMLVRIAISWNIEIKKHIRLSSFVAEIVPNKGFVAALTIVLAVSYQVKNTAIGNNYLSDLAVGGVLCGTAVLPVLYEYKQQLIALIPKNPNKAHIEQSKQS